MIPRLCRSGALRAALTMTMVTTALCGYALAAERSGQGAPVSERRSDATDATRRAQAASVRALDFSDEQAFEDAQRGLVAAPSGQIRDANGRVVWDFEALPLGADAPPTVHPGLWRQARLNHRAGLFKVTEGVWQVRGFDLANMTVIRGETGWIVVDPLTTEETAAAAWAFVRQHLGERPVSAMIFTHSHVDHFGGALGVLSAEEAVRRRVPVVAPEGFLAEATSENVLVGPAMARRAGYMYGSQLPRDAKGVVDTGLGVAVANGHIGILPPTITVRDARQPMTLDGVKVVFHNVPGTEAPAEMTFELPELKAFGAAELVSQTLHNLYTLRGAKVRDALAWSRFIDEALHDTQGAEVIFLQHGWPVWGRERVAALLTTQRDTYRYIHDQTVRLINAGLTGAEIADTLTLPASLSKVWSSRGYYGTVRHNVRAVYQQYMGWFDAHPANLDPLPPVDVARRYVALAGGPKAALEAAQKAFDEGDYRWAAELLKHLVLARADDGVDAQARELQARAFEQLGYAAESGPWRNFYLTGAQELRHGPATRAGSRGLVMGMLAQTPIDQFLDAMAASLNGPRADGVALAVDLNFTDAAGAQEQHSLWVENAVLHHRRGPSAGPQPPSATLTLSKNAFLRLSTGQATPSALIRGGELRVQGDFAALRQLFGLLDKPSPGFPIVTR